MTEDGTRPMAPVFWLISRDGGDGRDEILTVGGALALFGFEEEADMFLWFGRPGDGWRVREYGGADLAALLGGPLAGVERVALDPLPEKPVGTHGQAVLDRRCLLERLAGRDSLSGETA